MTKYLFILLLYSLAISLAYALPADRYQFDDSEQRVEFYQLLKELRCLVCQNQDLSDSNAALAEDLRQEVYALLQQGYGKDEVLRYVTDRYGDFILFKPPLKAGTYVLWFAPFVLLVLTVGLLLYRIKRRNIVAVILTEESSRSDKD